MSTELFHIELGIGFHLFIQSLGRIAQILFSIQLEEWRSSWGLFYFVSWIKRGSKSN